ncbi:hypothetical protein HA402_014349 [Bradysia odoriphaga]|nr:hypothetical protein HA402_014349 [Bradysia odoriphaga]
MDDIAFIVTSMLKNKTENKKHTPSDNLATVLCKASSFYNNPTQSYKVLSPDEIVQDVVKFVKLTELLRTFWLSSFQLNPTTTRILLNHCKWDEATMTERLFENPEKLYRDANVIDPDNMAVFESASLELIRIFDIAHEWHHIGIGYTSVHDQLIETLNNPTGGDFTILRTKQLILNQKYKVMDFFVMPTKYGKKVVATIQSDESVDVKYFLPPRYSLIVKRWADCPEDVDCSTLYMTLVGFRKDKYKSPILKFSVDESNSDLDTEKENEI